MTFSKGPTADRPNDSKRKEDRENGGSNPRPANSGRGEAVGGRSGSCREEDKRRSRQEREDE